MLNNVIVTGKMASPLRRIVGSDGREAYSFILATFDPDGKISFPTVIVRNPPEFLLSGYNRGRKLHEQATVTVVGWIRTNNLSAALKDEVVKLARRAGAPGKIILRLQAVLSSADAEDLRARRVGMEVVAEQVFQGGEWG